MAIYKIMINFVYDMLTYRLYYSCKIIKYELYFIYF